MKTRSIIPLVSLLGLALLALGILLWQAVPVRAQSADILYVAPGGACSGTPNCYASVQAAVDAAASGDEIRVAAGTYTGVSARPRKDITATGVVTQVVYLFSTAATLEGNTITGNTATVLGGGVDVASCSPALSSNLISDNTAGTGGGVYLWYSHSILTNNVVADNQATNAGPGLWIGGSQPTLLQTTVARNTGGGGSGVFVTDSGSGTYSTAAMTNTIVVNQAVGVSVDAGSVAAVDGVLWFGNGTNSGGAGATTVARANSGDPAFTSDGYHLTAGSAAINKGVNAGVMTDIDGQSRFGLPDLGADEYWPPGFPKYIYLPLIMNGQ